MTFKPPKGFTAIELPIIFAIVLIVLIVLGIAVSIINGDSILPNKQQCLNAGGKWSEGILYGRMTQLCTYN